MDMIDTLEKALDKNAALIAGVKPSQLGDATPCKDFDCRGLINHIIGGNYFLASMMSGTAPGGDDPGDLAGDDAVTAFEQSKKIALDAFRAAPRDGEFSFATMKLGFASAVGLALMEATIHGWDLARATGQPEEADPAVIEMVMRGAKQIPPEWRNAEGNPFAPAVSVPDDAPPLHKLVAELGRTP